MQVGGWVWAGVCLLAVLGCSERGLQSVDAAFAHSPVALVFGPTGVHQTKRAVLTLRNEGRAPLTVHGIEGDHSDLEVVAGGPFRLGAGEVRGVEVALTPTEEGGISGRLTVRTDSASAGDQGVAEIPFIGMAIHGFRDRPGEPVDLGEGAGACVAVLPRAIDFGAPPPGTSVERRAHVVNGCPEEVSVGALQLRTFEGGRFEALQAGAGFQVPPGTSRAIIFRFTPEALGRSAASAHLEMTARGVVLEEELSLEGSARAYSPCQARLTPPVLSFGRVAVGSTSRLSVVVENTGPTDCYLDGMALAPGGAASITAGARAGSILRPGQRRLMTVTFRPRAEGEALAVAQARINHPTSGLLDTTVRGEGVRSCLALEPPTLDFGAVGLTCGPSRGRVRALNGCGEEVTLTSAELTQATSSELDLPNPSMPRVLAPGQSAELEVRFSPLDEGPESAALLLGVDDGLANTVGIQGRGERAPTRTDRFVQQVKSQVDVLFVIDNSGSMMEEQESVGKNLGAFLSAADLLGIDYQIGVTTTGIDPSPGGWTMCPGGVQGGEHGRLFPADGSSPRLLTPSTADATQAFEKMVNVGTCHWLEQGLEAATRALSSPLVGGADDPDSPLPDDGNLGLIREGAKLAVIFVSDEEDVSPKGFDQYVDFFRQLKGGDPSMLSISAVVGPEDLSTCPTASSAGLRYLSLTRQFGGVAESICTGNWAESLRMISGNAFGPQRIFRLSGVPFEVDSVALAVNGRPVTTGYEYDVSTNSVAFDPSAVPEAGAVVEITYRIGCGG